MSTDQIYQEFKLYIEGVQVPFINMSINQGYGYLPTANITIPPQAGLMDLGRFYQPKVLIVFTERDTGLDKILFTGIITNPRYNKSKSGSGNIGISYECKHRYNLISECILDYSGYIRDTSIGGTASFYVDQMNSQDAVVASLTGITSVNTDPTKDIPNLSASGATTIPTDVLPSALAEFANRLIGMPGVILNFWNQLNRAAFNKEISTLQGTFIHVYKPLIEDGLQFFKRMTGHMVIEKDLNLNREEGCIPNKNNGKPILTPPCYKLFLKSAIQSNLTIDSLRTHLQNSNELTNMYQIFQTYFSTMEYEILTLASPAEVVKNPGDTAGKTTYYAVDTIIKPNMPFYYSPACNILYPNMYTDINVAYDDDNMPTRLDVKNNASNNSGTYDLHFRAPASIREAIASKNSSGNQDLSHTKASSFGAIGKFELGRGIKHEAVSMPNWIAAMISSIKESDGKKQSFTAPTPDSSDGVALKKLQDGWNLRFPGKEKLNPWDPASNIDPYERLLFSSSDYYFTKRFASTKAGNVVCVFNPYIIPGYPMDILEVSPNLPSFHAMCSAVSHNISANGVSTNVSFVAASTYLELANYYIPFVNPYLQVTLGLASNPTLVNTDTTGEALAKANEFYSQVLGVNAVTPEMIYDFTNGVAKSVKMSTDGKIVDSGVPIEFHSTEEDLLTLCKRNIESKDDFAVRFNLKYIDMTPQNYTTSGVTYKDDTLVTNSTKFEMGQNQFLIYDTETFNKVNGITNV